MIVSKVEKRSFFGRLSVSMKQQNELDPYLTSFYPVYSLVSNMTNPNIDYGQKSPEIISFMVNIDFIPEGESDMAQVNNSEMIVITK